MVAEQAAPIQPLPEPYTPHGALTATLTQAEREFLWREVFPWNPVMSVLAREYGMGRTNMRKEYARWKEAGGVSLTPQRTMIVVKPAPEPEPDSLPDTASLTNPPSTSASPLAMRLAEQVLDPLLDPGFISDTVQQEMHTFFYTQRDEWMARLMTDADPQVLGVARFFDVLTRCLDAIREARAH